MKNKHHESRNLEDHAGKSKIGELDGNKWEAQELEVHSDPLIDTESGRPIVLRFFEFNANPDVFISRKPTKQDLLNGHASQIKMFLWKDGLEIVDAVEPRVIVSKKKDSYRIFVTCQAKPGVAVLDTPQSLQNINQNNGQPN